MLHGLLLTLHGIGSREDGNQIGSATAGEMHQSKKWLEHIRHTRQLMVGGIALTPGTEANKEFLG
jgi:hypothetical protein